MPTHDGYGNNMSCKKKIKKLLEQGNNEYTNKSVSVDVLLSFWIIAILE